MQQRQNQCAFHMQKSHHSEQAMRRPKSSGADYDSLGIITVRSEKCRQRGNEAL